MKKVLLLFAPERGSVETVADRFVSLFKEAEIKKVPVHNCNAENIKSFNNILFGCSTVGAETWQDAEADNEWDRFFNELAEKNISLKNKNMAIYGLGNQILYPDHFVDTIHYIKEEIEKNGGKVFGEWPTDGFDFTDSQAIENDKFEGLPLDEDNENDLTDSRILKWLETYKNNFH